MIRTACPLSEPPSRNLRPAYLVDPHPRTVWFEPQDGDGGPAFAGLARSVPEKVPNSDRDHRMLARAERSPCFSVSSSAPAAW